MTQSALHIVQRKRRKAATLTAHDRLMGAWPSTALYLVMVWSVLVAAGPLIELTPAKSIFLLVAGGISYTAGVAFFLLCAPFNCNA
jgi:hemolysin III